MTDNIADVTSTEQLDEFIRDIHALQLPKVSISDIETDDFGIGPGKPSFVSPYPTEGWTVYHEEEEPEDDESLGKRLDIIIGQQADLYLAVSDLSKKVDLLFLLTRSLVGQRAKGEPEVPEAKEN